MIDQHYWDLPELERNWTPIWSFITQYSPFSFKIKKIISKYMNVLNAVPSLRNKSIRCVWRRNKNLKERLSAAVLWPLLPVSSEKEISGYYKCGQCSICIVTRELQKFTYQKEYVLRHRTTCGSQNVIHAIACPCDLLYIGKTSRSFKTRILEHKSRLKHKVMQAPLVPHCQEFPQFWDVALFLWGTSKNSDEWKIISTNFRSLLDFSAIDFNT